MTILSFQSRVVWGHVGNSVSEFALRRVGLDVWPLDTVCFSHHPGHGRPRGRIRSARELGELVQGLSEVGVLANCQAVLSGYLGSRANGSVVLEAVCRLKATTPGALYCCDPVMGDHDSGLYVEQSQVDFFRHAAVATADILTPNHFELETLVGQPLPTLDAVLSAAGFLCGRGPSMLLVSSLNMSPVANELGTLLVAKTGAWLATTPRLALRARGAGDLLAAHFLARRLRGAAAPACLSGAVAATFAVLQATAGAPELCLVAAQQAMARPSKHPVSLRRVR